MPAAAPTRRQRGFTLCLLLLVAIGAAAVWTLVAVALNQQCGWMAVLSAIDAVVLLRFTRVRPGAGRALLAVLATLLSVALANWWIAGTQIGQMVGLPPWDSVWRLGWSHGQTLVSLANSGVELAWYGVGLIVAALAGR